MCGTTKFSGFAGWFTWSMDLAFARCYSVSSAYNNLTDVDIIQHQNPHQFVWLKVVPPKVSIFSWRLLCNIVLTRDNLLQRRVISASEQGCTTNCCVNEDMDHLFVKCDFYGRLWYFISSWLGFCTTYNGKVLEHIYQFGSLGGFSYKVQSFLNVIWLPKGSNPIFC